MLLSTLVRPLYCLHLLDLCTHPAGPHAGHAPGANVVVRDDAVLDAERAEADVAHALLARLVRHDGRVHLPTVGHSSVRLLLTLTFISVLEMLPSLRVSPQPASPVLYQLG